MRIRIRFSKNEIVKYLGHLDIMRAFQRFFNCADVRMEYSVGFNPHQKMHFALPLGVGIISEAEYLDAQIADGQDTEMIRDNLNKACKGAFTIINVKELLPDARKAMASVCYAEYEIIFKEKIDLNTEKYLSRDSIILQKKTKTGIKDVDVKALIVRLEQTDSVLSVLMKTGSQDSIKPELIAADLLEFNGHKYVRDNIQICRKELYAQDLIPLDQYQVV